MAIELRLSIAFRLTQLDINQRITEFAIYVYAMVL